MQISLAQSEFFSNSGFYWTSGEDCSSSYSKEAGNAVNQEVGDNLFTNANYIDSKIDFVFCIEEPDEGASGFIATAVYEVVLVHSQLVTRTLLMTVLANIALLS